MNQINPSVTKMCPVPTCNAIWHNCPKSHTKCNDCGGNIIQINNKTYVSKYTNWFWQYDYKTGNFYRPETINP